LNENGLIDEALMRQLLNLIPSKFQTTFHRAFDLSCFDDWKSSLDVINNLGFKRLLTSGQEKSAFEGRKRIREYIDYINSNNQESKNLIIMPGAGITSTNFEIILNDTLCKEFHASCRSSRSSKMLYKNDKISMGTSDSDEYKIKYTDISKVKILSEIFNRNLK
jgi:copper homeostasis protein